jgi:hypothetical protein
MQPLNSTTPFVDPETITITGVAKGALTTSGTSSGAYTVYLIDSPFVTLCVLLQFYIIIGKEYKEKI